MAKKFDVMSLVGVRIKDVRLAKPSESDLEGTVVLELWSGLNLVVLSDDEGNQPGTLQVQFPDNTAAYINGHVLRRVAVASGGAVR